VAYAEKVSGKPLADLFDTWLYEPSRPKQSALGGERTGKQATPKSWQKIREVNSAHRH
jgi:CubicO group peptidase (beta-lactamase class C family)